jgi:hypothetical protein
MPVCLTLRRGLLAVQRESSFSIYHFPFLICHRLKPWLLREV